MSFAKLALGVSGIYASYLINSILLQKIFTYEYPLSGKDQTGKGYFQYSDLVQLISNIFCLIYAWASLRIKNERKSPIPTKQVVILGVLYFIDVSTINCCLYYIPYPVRVVGDKLVYLVSVVIGVYFSRVSNKSKFKLGKQKILIAVMITMGTLMFSYSYNVSKESQVLYEPSQMWKGFVLLGISVVAEALLSDSQAYNKIAYKPTMDHLLFSINLMGILFSLGSLLIKNQLIPSIQFCFGHKQILSDLFIYSTLTILGQISVYFIILNFKQHMFPLISTTRKVVTVLLSIYIYNHPTNVLMWISLVLVFGGLVCQLADQLDYNLFGLAKLKVEKKD